MCKALDLISNIANKKIRKERKSSEAEKRRSKVLYLPPFVLF
jgi:hypothetical protein